MFTHCPVCCKRLRECIRHQFHHGRLLYHSPWTGRIYLLKSWYKYNRLQKRLYDWLQSAAGSFWDEYWRIETMKKRTASARKEKGKYTRHGDLAFKEFPTIERYMWECWFEDGTPREIGSMKVQLVDGGVAISLSDPAERCTAFTTAASLREALELLETALTGPGDPWRPWPKGFGKK